MGIMMGGVLFVIVWCCLGPLMIWRRCKRNAHAKKHQQKEEGHQQTDALSDDKAAAGAGGHGPSSSDAANAGAEPAAAAHHEHHTGGGMPMRFSAAAKLKTKTHHRHKHHHTHHKHLTDQEKAERQARAHERRSRRRATQREDSRMQLTAAFSLLDENGDGHLNRLEFAHACHADPAENPEVDRLFDLLDEEHAGELDLKHIAHALRTNAEAKELARHFDALHRLVELAAARKRRRSKMLQRKGTLQSGLAAASHWKAKGKKGKKGKKKKLRGTAIKKPEAADNSFQARLARFYAEYNPQKTEADVERTLAQYAGKEDVLFAALVRKYGPEPSDQAAAPPADAHERLTRFYAQPVMIFYRGLFSIERAALHSHGLGSHSRVLLCKFMTGTTRTRRRPTSTRRWRGSRARRTCCSMRSCANTARSRGASRARAARRRRCRPRRPAAARRGGSCGAASATSSGPT